MKDHLRGKLDLPTLLNIFSKFQRRKNYTPRQQLHHQRNRKPVTLRLSVTLSSNYRNEVRPILRAVIQYAIRELSITPCTAGLLVEPFQGFLGN